MDLAYAKITPKGDEVPIFQVKKCSLENVHNNVQISSPQLLLSKRYSRLKLPFLQ